MVLGEFARAPERRIRAACTSGVVAWSLKRHQ